MRVNLISKTQGVGELEGRTIEEIIVWNARRSSGRKDLFANPERLLKHCAEHGHWSVFDTVTLGFEIVTSRAIAHELIRHWTLKPQEFSQRYAIVVDLEPVELRWQSQDNRQSSTEPLPSDHPAYDRLQQSLQQSLDTYHYLIDLGIARECARFVLPECAQSNLTLTGTARSWITFLNSRLHQTAQKEARLVAELIRDEIIRLLPTVSAAWNNFENAYNEHFI